MSLTAYQSTLKATENPRDVEYRLFGQVTRALLEAQPLPRTDPKVIEALDWNRRMWSTLASDCASDANAMPPQMRAGIISISMFVARYSSQQARILEDQTRLTEAQEKLRSTLTARFAQTDTRVGASRSTLSFLQNQIDAWNAPRN